MTDERDSQEHPAGQSDLKQETQNPASTAFRQEQGQPTQNAFNQTPPASAPSGNPPQQPPQIVYIREQPAQAARRAPWGLVAALIVIAVIAALWMSGVWGSLLGIQSGVNQNAQTLSHQQSTLGAIQQQLAAIRAQLAALAQQIGNLFARLFAFLAAKR